MPAEEIDYESITDVEIIARDKEGAVVYTMKVKVKPTRKVRFDVKTIFDRDIDRMFDLKPVAQNTRYDWHLWGPMEEVLVELPKEEDEYCGTSTVEAAPNIGRGYGED